MRVLIKSVVIITALFLYPIIYAKDHSLQVGDLVLRAGVNVDSLIIQKLGNVHYSHIGIITETAPEIIVVHSTTDDDPAHLNQVIKTPFHIFISDEFAKSYTVIRPNFLTSEERSTLSSMIQAQMGAPYVLKSRENDNLYCTTLIEQPLLKFRPDIQLKWHEIDFGPFKGAYLFPDTFMEIEGMEEISH